MSKNNLALMLTLFLIALIVLTTPSSSLTLLLSGLSGSYIKGSSIDFFIEASISSPEHVPINFIELNITGNSSYLCKIYMNSTVEGCSFLTVKSIEYDDYGYGYGYGYDYGYHYLGYGYGYGPNIIRVNLSLNTAGLEGNYQAKAAIYAGIGSDAWKFFSPSYSFTVTSFTQAPAGGIGGSKYYFEVLGVTQTGEGQYMAKIKNGGKEKIEVYLHVHDANYTSSSFIINPGEIIEINYTLNGSFDHKLAVVGKVGENVIIKELMVKSSPLQEGQEEKPEEMVEEAKEPTEGTEAKEEKSAITGLAVGIDFFNKYKLGIMLVGVLAVSAVLVFKFK
jgi:hypothetical protein